MGFFDRAGAGAYDSDLVIAVVGILLLTYFWQRAIVKSCERRFRRARNRAQHAWEKQGIHEPLTRAAIVEALECWEQWQRRSRYDVNLEHPRYPADWEVVSLMGALPEGAREREPWKVAWSA